MKAWLEHAGFYARSSRDHFRDRAFEYLLPLNPFDQVKRELGDNALNALPETGFDFWSAWEARISDLEMRFAGEEIERLMFGNAEESDDSHE